MGHAGGTTLPTTLLCLTDLKWRHSPSASTELIQTGSYQDHSNKSTYSCKSPVCSEWKQATGGPTQTIHSSRTLRDISKWTTAFQNNFISDLLNFQNPPPHFMTITDSSSDVQHFKGTCDSGTWDLFLLVLGTVRLYSESLLKQKWGGGTKCCDGQNTQKERGE